MHKRTKDFEGCLECRRRKVKCDKSQPSCQRCIRIGKKCPGFSFALVWVSPNCQNSKAQGRGGPGANTTWRGWPILDFDEIDTLLTRLDESKDGRTSMANPACALFAVFDVESVCVASTMRKNAEIMPRPNLPPLGLDWDPKSRHLFHHYISNVSCQMMPFDGSHNPWKTHYPRLALENECVRHALLGQAAAHLFHLGCDVPSMKISSLVHRSTALTQLQSILYNTDRGLFEVKLAAILSLVMSDVYFGTSEGWRAHVYGAVEIAVTSASESPWSGSEMAWLTAQSLCLLALRAKIDGSFKGASEATLLQRLELPSCILAPVSRRSEYGFTIGASQDLASSLADCAAVIAETNAQTLTENLRSRIAELTQRLLCMTLSASEMIATATQASTTSDLQRLHIHIFALGLLIRLQRSTLDPHPSELQVYTTSLFRGVAAFQKVANLASNDRSRLSSPTIWPVFHAAVELYRPEDQEYARSVWLNEIENTAIGNRKHVRSVVERIWSIKAKQAQAVAESSCSELGMTVSLEEAAGAMVVDWIEVTRDMGLDLLLV